MECSNCGVSGPNTRLFDVISGEGIVKLCEGCLSSDSVPLKRSTGLMPGIEKKQTTYERLSNIAGIKDVETHKMNVFGSAKKEELQKQETTLRDLIDKKFDRIVKEDEPKKREDLVDNFHWVIMRGRRAKKMSVSQVARDIGESERVVKMAEQGILPEGYEVIIKLEGVLGVNLLKPEFAEMLKRQPKRLGFDKISSKTLTISDLHEIKKEEARTAGINFEEIEKPTPYWRRVMNKIINKKEEKEGGILVEKIEEDLSEDKVSEEPMMQAEPDFEREEFGSSEEVEPQEVSYDDTSLQMTTMFSGGREAEKVTEDKSLNEKKPEKELSQEDIDDLIFGRK